MKYSKSQVGIFLLHGILFETIALLRLLCYDYFWKNLESKADNARKNEPLLFAMPCGNRAQPDWQQMENFDYPRFIARQAAIRRA